MEHLKLKEKLQYEMQKSSWQAGRAEVATGVLHNVGNVLNSVNVSASLLLQSSNDDTFSFLSKASDLINQKADDLPTFFRQDTRGKNFPVFFDKLARSFEKLQDSQIDELNSIVKHVDHIKKIIATQQANAIGAGLYEPVDPTELFEDTVNVVEADEPLRDIQIHRNYSFTEKFDTNKHTMLQVLLNLVKNSVRALRQSEKQEKVITLEIKDDNEFIYFSVTDNGIGISKENQAKLFQHGFTTSSDGHGFGLHSCANSIQQMGGSVSCQSSGAGQGAKFMVRVPKLANATSDRKNLKVRSN